MDRPPLEATTAVNTFDESRIYRDLMHGDRDTWNEFYEYFRNRLPAFFKKRKVYLEQDQDDLFHETMVSFFASLERYDPSRCPLKNWVYCIATNVMASHQKKYSAAYNNEKSGDDALLEADSNCVRFPMDSSEGVTPGIRDLRVALNKLPESDRMILALRSERDSELTRWEDIAEELGIGISAAKMRYKRACSKLRDMMNATVTTL